MSGGGGESEDEVSGCTRVQTHKRLSKSVSLFFLLISS